MRRTLQTCLRVFTCKRVRVHKRRLIQQSQGGSHGFSWPQNRNPRDNRNKTAPSIEHPLPSVDQEILFQSANTTVAFELPLLSNSAGFGSLLDLCYIQVLVRSTTRSHHRVHQRRRYEEGGCWNAASIVLRNYLFFIFLTYQSLCHQRLKIAGLNTHIECGVGSEITQRSCISRLGFCEEVRRTSLQFVNKEKASSTSN